MSPILSTIFLMVQCLVWLQVFERMITKLRSHAQYTESIKGIDHQHGITDDVEVDH